MHLRASDRPFRTLPNPLPNNGLYRPASYWHETVSITPGLPLASDVSCDVAVVGGGFTGLSTAYELKKAAPSLEVVLLERTVVGHGASGRNGGFAMPLLGWDLTQTARSLGETAAGRAYRVMYDAVAHTRNVIRENGIDCDMEETGYLLLATCPARARRVREEVELAHRLGLDHQWLEGEALREHIRSDSFLGGSFDPHAFIMNPAKMARGMKAVLEGMGVRVYERTPLAELTDGRQMSLRTPGGSVRADQVVLAVNGYGGSLGFLSSGVHPVHTYIVLTEPLSEEDLDAIGWSRKRTSLETARNLIHYFRLTADNRILFGGEDATIYYGGAYRDEHAGSFHRLEARFRRFFPALGHVKVTHRWGGVLGVTLDMFPTFGVGGDHHTIFHACGYSGHGVSLGNYAGRILAPHILRSRGISGSDEPPRPFFFGRKPFAVPPDPLRYVGLQVYRGSLHAQDWWQRA